MKAVEITIHNFRSIHDATISLPHCGILVGVDNAGKFTVIDAIRAFYGKGKKEMGHIYFSILMILLFIASTPLFANESLTPEAAKAHVGEIRTVCGAVANTYYSCFVKDKPTFINFGHPYPDHVFSIAIMGADRDKFGNAPEDLFEGKSVCVTGRIESYDNKPLIVVRDKTQIRLTE